MQLNEFKGIVKDSGQFSINNRVNEIEASNFINEGYYHPRKPFPRKMVFSALSLIIILTMGLFVRLSVSPVTTLTIDINPSIEVDLNIFNRVVDITGTNQEGLEFIESIDYKNKSVDDVILSIYNTVLEMEYFSESEAYMLIGVYSDDYDSEVKLGDIISEITEVNILSIFLHNETNSDCFWNLSFSSQEASAEFDNGYENKLTNSDVEAPTNGYIETIFESFEDMANLANTYNISQTKLVLVIDVFNGSDEYLTDTDFQYLVNLDIPSLIDLYNNLD